jgi:thiosulfate dehydrogenase
MRKIATVLAVLVGLATPAWSDPPGRALFEAACATCHAAGGTGPVVAGQPGPYLARQMDDYRSGRRTDATMQAAAGRLTEAQQRDLVAYMASLPPPRPNGGAASPVGRDLARIGEWSAGVPACDKCHGSDGTGLPPQFPALAAQPVAYATSSLDAYRDGSRHNDPLGMMQHIAARLTDAEIAAVAQFYAAAPPAATRPADLPPDLFGIVVARGERMFDDTPAAAAPWSGNPLTCENCHLDRGRLKGSSPVWAMFGLYPQYRAKIKRVETLGQRIQDCFVYSMNGSKPPLDSDVIVGLESYIFWLSRGQPIGAKVDGHGYPGLVDPDRPPSPERGWAVYGAHCAFCHGADGAGTRVGARTPFPPLWGASSYNWGAGMTNVEIAAAFIAANMPFGLAGTLPDHDAWDVAAFIDSRPRPQDPHFTGDVAETARRFHPTGDYYGQRVDGILLGGQAP